MRQKKFSHYLGISIVKKETDININEMRQVTNERVVRGIASGMEMSKIPVSICSACGYVCVCVFVCMCIWLRKVIKDQVL